VALYAISYAAVKMVNYGILMWLPFYVSSGLDRGVTDQILLANLFDVGAIVGGIIAGRIMDKSGFRCLIMVPMLILSLPIFLSFRFITSSTFFMYYITVPILGFMIGGVANLIVSLISTDLGRRPDVSDDALSTITGIIDGTGSLGAGVG
jgi:OPA family glycerol-3-phosphate transporter-like MFS transporter 3